MLWVSELPGARWPPCAEFRLRWLATRTRHLAFIYIYAPYPLKHLFVTKLLGVELICWTIPIKKCMNNLAFFQPNLRRSSGSHCPVWRGMTHLAFTFKIYI